MPTGTGSTTKAPSPTWSRDAPARRPRAPHGRRGRLLADRSRRSRSAPVPGQLDAGCGNRGAAHLLDGDGNARQLHSSRGERNRERRLEQRDPLAAATAHDLQRHRHEHRPRRHQPAGRPGGSLQRRHPASAAERSSCESDQGTIALSPGLEETPHVQSITIKGHLSGCGGKADIEEGTYVAHLQTTEEVTCSTLASVSAEPTSTPISLSVKWIPSESGKSTGTLVMPLTEVAGAPLTGTLQGGPFASPQKLSASVYESFTGGPTCGAPGKKGAKAKPGEEGHVRDLTAGNRALAQSQRDRARRARSRTAQLSRRRPPAAARTACNLGTRF